MDRPDERFRSEQRIRHRREYEAARQAGASFDCGAFIMRVRADASLPSRRLGVIATKRIGNAVVRHRAKRLFREIFRRNQDALPDLCDVVILVRPNFGRFDYHRLEKRFVDSAQQACQRLK